MRFNIFRALVGYPTDIWPSLAAPVVKNTESHWIALYVCLGLCLVEHKVVWSKTKVLALRD